MLIRLRILLGRVSFCETAKLLTITILYDPETNGLQLMSPISPPETLLLLERAKIAVVGQASQVQKPLAIPTHDLVKQLLETR